MRSNMRDPNSQRLLAAYDAAHPVIAAGTPPLTRQAADAFTELWCFPDIGSVLAGAQLYDPSTAGFARTGNLTTCRYYHTSTLLLSESAQLK